MGLNIKNERVHALAREAARLTGKSQTGVIEEALVRLLREYEADPEAARVAQKLADVRALAAEYAADPGRDDLVIADAADLYDATTGLPR